MMRKEEFAERFAEVYKTAKKRDRGGMKWTSFLSMAEAYKETPCPNCKAPILIIS